MKVYKLRTERTLEYFTSKETAMKAYAEIDARNKWLDLLELGRPSAKLVFDILNGINGYALSITPIAAWTGASGEVYKRED